MPRKEPDNEIVLYVSKYDYQVRYECFDPDAPDWSYQRIIDLLSLVGTNHQVYIDYSGEIRFLSNVNNEDVTVLK